MGIDSKQILLAANEKNVAAWKSIYTSYYATLCSYAYRLVKDKNLSEDLVQDVLCNVWKSSRKFEDVNEFTYYLYRATYNQVLMHFRNNKYKEQYLHQVLQENEEFPDEMFAETIQEELIRHLYHYINELPEERRKIILLSIKGYSGQEIADQLNISIHTVKTQKYRSFKYLKEKLQDSILIFLLIHLS